MGSKKKHESHSLSSSDSDSKDSDASYDRKKYKKRRERSRSHSEERYFKEESRKKSKRELNNSDGRTDVSGGTSSYYNRSRNDESRGYRDRRVDHKYRECRDDSRRYSRSRRSNDKNREFNNRRNSRERDHGQRRRSRSKSFDHANAKWGKGDGVNKKTDGTVTKEKPNFSLSGKLTEETNTYKGVVIKYSEPPEARKAKRRWRLYPFKGEKALQTLYIHRESAYLIGRDRKVVDLPVDHPSCSKQHAVLQYRLVPFTREDGTSGKRVRPYLIDLDSANGTFINNKNIEPKKYVELLERDVIKFGFSSREYVLLHENSKDEALDDDVKLEEEDAKVKEENE